MFLVKNKYFLMVESIKDIDLSNIKNAKKLIIIYRYKKIREKLHEIIYFRKLCKIKKIKFYVSNNLKLMINIKADGLYISAYNKSLNFGYLKNLNYKLIGSAHNIKELNLKILQGCSQIIYSRLFQTSYINKRSFLGVIKFNLLKLKRNEDLIPLGGIRLNNLGKLNMVKCDSFAILSEVKKKPAKIFSRLF